MRLRLPLFLLPPDTFERHYLVAQHLKSARVSSVLDVGGEGLLRRFLPRVRCVAVNVDGSGDARYDGVRLPFRDASFDAVVSLDTIEHLPKAARQGLVDELRRVAAAKLAISAPFGSALHAEMERRALDLYREARGTDNRYLREHVENGLPDVAELDALLDGLDHRLLFCGDCEWQFARFRRRCEQGVVSQSGLRDLLSILKDGNYWRRHRLSEVPTEHANRVYAFADVGIKTLNHRQ